jgi:membrane protein implicated in regulation of membrane protease activity
MNRFRTRLPALLSLWAGAAAAEAILFYVFLSRPYFRTFFAPFAVGVLVAAAVGTRSVLRLRRRDDRRARERRVAGRRLSE